MRRILPLFIAVLILATPAGAASPKAGDSAPDFSLSSIEGKRYTLSEMKGKVVLIGMFHICVPCMNQAMEFEKVRKALDSDQLVILGINTSGDSKEAVAKYLAGFSKPIHFPYLLDPGLTVHKNFTQRDMPTVLIIDAKGVIKARSPAVGADQLIPYLKKLF